ncbi:hypothetical protein LCGC14_0693130 [marine sediment metagenome]|uniref:DOD-type homing endonuclease domain-containing protein n=2 Tax=marine sediment metagenome TaxID=412755 RepID=A0A0F9R576_9ZZZZ
MSPVATAARPTQRTVSYHNLHPGQQAVLASTAKIILMLAGTGGGKALALDTPILTTAGWREMGDLQVGDRVFDERGVPCRVVYTSPTFLDHRCYRVRFSDGTDVVADEGHEWYAWDHSARRASRRAANPLSRPRVVTTPDLRPQNGRRWSIQVAGPLQYVSRHFTVDPYVLGAWLGDGSSRTAAITIGDEDAPQMIKNLISAGCPVGAEYQRQGNCATYSLGVVGKERDEQSGQYRANGSLCTSLKTLEVWGNKHIPLHYQRTHEWQRMALLQGLMDTDGHVAKDGGCEYVSTNKRLAEDVEVLVRGLGIKATLRTSPCAGSRSGEKHRLVFRTDKTVFRLPRKSLTQALAPYRAQVNEMRYVEAVEPVDSVPTRCIAVDSPSHLFLCTQALIPTHNTKFGPIWCLEQHRKFPDQHGMIVAPHTVLEDTTQDLFLQLMDRKLHLGQWVNKQSRTWQWHGSEAKVFFCSSDTPESLEGKHAGWIWMDEFGQKQFPEEAWIAIKRRVGFHEASVLGTTTPYILHWILDLWDDAAINRYFSVPDMDKRATAIAAWEAGEPMDWGWLQETVQEKPDGDEDIEVIRFASIANPKYPLKSFERARKTETDWQFRMFYLAEQARSAGLIYGEVLDAIYVDELPDDAHGDAKAGRAAWSRYAGLDFGYDNPTHVLFGALSPKSAGDVLYLYDEYVRRKVSDMENARAAHQREVRRAWGDSTAPTAIATYRKFGWDIAKAGRHEVRAGISEVIGRAKEGRLKIVRGACPVLDRQILTYVWDEKRPDTPVKKEDHGPDALRYLVHGLRRGQRKRQKGPIWLWNRDVM